jgi:hypothetical protein
VRLLADLRAKFAGVAHEGCLRVNHVVCSRPACPCVHTLAPSSVLYRDSYYMLPQGKIKRGSSPHFKLIYENPYSPLLVIEMRRRAKTQGTILHICFTIFGLKTITQGNCRTFPLLF